LYYKLLEPRTDEVQRAFIIISSSIGVYEKQLMTVYHCNPEWPVCLYDFSFKNRVPNYFCLKVKKPLTSFIIPQYFGEDYMTFPDPDNALFTEAEDGSKRVNDD
jgi:hypothetical protein